MNRKMTQELLKSLLRYDFVTGDFYTLRPIAKAQHVPPGTLAGCVTLSGHRRISLYQKQYMAHKLVWLYFYGYLPRKEIDHIDCDGLNNRIENLRLVTRSQNAQNRHQATCTSTHGWLGATYNKNSKKWFTQINIRGHQKILGRFKEPEPAHILYLMAKREFHIEQIAV